MNAHGLLACTRYAFPPNKLQYCGPDKMQEMLDYQNQQYADQGLAEIVQEFQTLYPYLTLIATENNIKDPFDERVVEAYWIGNNLLENVSMKEFYKHFIKALKLKKKIKKKQFEKLTGKIPQGALPHHAFHVLNVFTRTGHHTVSHTLETMDECRIGWGEVEKCQMSNPSTPLRVKPKCQMIIKTKPLVLKDGKLALGRPRSKAVYLPTELRITNYELRKEAYVSFHWSVFCDILTKHQAESLEKYTIQAINLANNTI